MNSFLSNRIYGRSAVCQLEQTGGGTWCNTVLTVQPPLMVTVQTPQHLL